MSAIAKNLRADFAKAQPVYYRIYWKHRLSGETRQGAGLFTEADKDLWLKHFKQTEPGYDVWAEPVRTNT